MTATLAPLATCARTGCPLPAFVTHHEAGQPVALCYSHYEDVSNCGQIVRGSDGRRYEVVADSIDLEVGELRRENARLRAELAELKQGQGAK